MESLERFVMLATSSDITRAAIDHGHVRYQGLGATHACMSPCLVCICCRCRRCFRCIRRVPEVAVCCFAVLPQVWTAERSTQLGMAVSSMFKGYTTTAAQIITAMLKSVTKFTIQVSGRTTQASWHQGGGVGVAGA